MGGIIDRNGESDADKFFVFPNQQHPCDTSLPETLLKVTLLHGCFSRFSNFTNGTKSRNASNINITTEKQIHNQFSFSDLLISNNEDNFLTSRFRPFS